MNKKFILPKDVQAWLDGQNPRNKKNRYHCTTCGGIVITEDVDKGVTPFMLACRATIGCKGVMESSFYTCDQSLPATYEFYRPESLDGLPPQTVDHCMKGGLLLRPIMPWLSDVAHDS